MTKTLEEKAAYMREWRKANRDRARELSRDAGRRWRAKPGNQDKISDRNRRWRATNPDKARMQRQKEDRLAKNLRSRLNQAVRGGFKAGSAVRDLGCSIDEFRAHIEAQFLPGMSWDNWGKWHIDHVLPLAWFDLTDRVQFLTAAHYTNMQPLWAVNNLSKGSR